MPWTEPGGEKFALGTPEEQEHWQNEYSRIVSEAAGRTPGTETGTLDGDGSWVGMRLPRNDALYKVRGRARYAANLSPDGMLHCRFVRSEHPHARILNIDVSKARTAAGVRAVLTAEDIAPDRLLIGTLTEDTPVLAGDRVRFAGEPIVAIAAESVAEAEAACLRVDVDYEPLEIIPTPEAALAPDAIRIDPEGNVIGDLHHQAGDVEAGLAEADIVLENTFTTEPVDHCFLEPPAGLAFLDPDGVLTVLVCTQYPHYHHRQIARVTGLPMDRVRVVQTVVGGAFGGKMDNTVECVVSLLALETGRPVRMIYTREEVFTTTTKRHAMTIRQRLGATRDGRLTALDASYLADGGAYRSYSLIVGGRCVIHTGMPYRIPNVRAHYTVTLTNHPPSGAMRSFGVVKVAFAIESQLNELADRLGMSPIAIRRINGMVDGERTPIGQTLWDIGFHQTLDAIEPIYEERKRALATRDGNADGRRRGLGIACLGYGIGYSGVRNPSTARMRVDARGVVTALCGTPDIGTGSDVALAQIAAQAAGIDVRRVRVVSGDSTRTDDSGPTSASRTTYFSGNAASICGRDFKDRFESAVARRLGVAREQVRLEGDQVLAGNERIRFEDACRSIAAEVGDICGYGKFDPDISVSILTFKGNPYPSYTYATHLAEVAIDDELGEVEVVRYWAAHDAGTVVNPTGAEGQIEGGVAMGIGQALWEKVVREDGITMNPHYRDYLLPGAKDVPCDIECIFVDNRDRTGPYGAKGVAEVSMIPVPAAVASAITDAVGVRPNRLPMESEYLLQLIEAHRKA